MLTALKCQYRTEIFETQQPESQSEKLTDNQIQSQNNRENRCYFLKQTANRNSIRFTIPQAVHLR